MMITAEADKSVAPNGQLLAGLRIALLCLMPDPGHVIPLLRIGKLIEQHGGIIRFFGPAETSLIVSESAIASENIGSVRPAGHEKMLATMISSSETYQKIILNKFFALKYLNPIVETVFSQLDRINEEVSQFRPALVLADDHMLRGAYKLIADRCDAPLILHHAYGSHYCPERPTREKTMKAMDKIGVLTIDILTRIAGASSARIERVLKPSIHFENERRSHYINRKWTELGQLESQSKYKTYEISSGLAPLEEKYIKSANRPNTDRICFGSINPSSNKTISEDLKQWLELSDKKNIIYICFGSMVSRISADNKTLIRALLRSKHRILWASPLCPWTESEPLPTVSVRWEKWAPQSSILAHCNVKIFITHAGSGAIQETLWFAKPAICIPLHADQPYNAYVAERLGFGKTIKKNQITERKVIEAIEFLESSRTTAAINRLSEEMHNLSGAVIAKLICNITLQKTSIEQSESIARIGAKAQQY